MSAPARANDRQQLVDGAVGLDPARCKCGLHHRVLAADVVDGDRHVEAIARGAHDVEIRQAGLDHHDVGTFGDVERDLAHRLANVGRIHLIGAAVAELRRRTGRFAKRTVECRRVLGAVGHDRYVDVSLPVERGADRADAAIHHVRRGDDVDARLGVRHGDA